MGFPLWMLIILSALSTGLSVTLFRVSKRADVRAGSSADIGDRLEAEGATTALGVSVFYTGVLWVTSLVLLISNAAFK